MAQVNLKEVAKGFLARLASRKFLLALIGAVVAFGNAYWEWGLEVEQVLAVLLPILAYIGVEGARDIKAAR